MFEILGKIVIGVILGTIVGVGITVTHETIKDGGRVGSGSKRDKDIDKRVRENLSKGSCSSREELQEWWDTYHPSK